MGLCIYIFKLKMSYLIYILKLKMSYLICRIPGWGGWGWNEGRHGGKLPRFRTTQHTLNISNQSFLPIHVYPTPSLSSFVTHDYRNVGFICILFIHTNTFFKLANRKKKPTTPSSTHQIVLLHNSKFRINDFYACRLGNCCISSPILLCIKNYVVQES